MKQINVNGKELLLVEVPQNNARDFKLVSSLRIEKIHVLDMFNSSLYFKFDNDWYGHVHLDGISIQDWRILGSGKASEITEDEWAKTAEAFVLGTALIGYCNYGRGEHWIKSATESGHSLLSLHGFKPETTVILIKQ